MSESNLSSAAKAERRIAAAHAARHTVDNQGKPTSGPTVYKYDDNGRLISAEPE